MNIPLVSAGRLLLKIESTEMFSQMVPIIMRMQLANAMYDPGSSVRLKNIVVRARKKKDTDIVSAGGYESQILPAKGNTNALIRTEITIIFK